MLPKVFLQPFINRYALDNSLRTKWGGQYTETQPSFYGSSQDNQFYGTVDNNYMMNGDMLFQASTAF